MIEAKAAGNIVLNTNDDGLTLFIEEGREQELATSPSPNPKKPREYPRPLRWRRRESNPYTTNHTTWRYRAVFPPKGSSSQSFLQRIESPPVPSSPLESTPVLETFWRRVDRRDERSHE